MNKHQQTVYGIEGLIYQLLGITPVIEEYTTVNEKLGILPTTKPTITERVLLGVLVAGNKGHGSMPGVDGIQLITPNDHMATDASLYSQLPLASRDLDNDLTEAQRARFCLRKIELVNGVNKINYYGYRLLLDANNVSVTKQRVTLNDQGAEEFEPFIPNNGNLNPIPVELPDSGAIVASNVSIKVEAIIKVTLTAELINEFVEAIKFKYNGDERYAVMSEFGLCTGANRVISVPGSSGNINFNESIGTQIYAFTMEHKALYYNTQKLEIEFNIGNQIPLFSPESIPTMEIIP